MTYAALRVVTGGRGFAALPAAVHLSVLFKWHSVESGVTSSLAPTPRVNGTQNGTLTISVAHSGAS